VQKLGTLLVLLLYNHEFKYLAGRELVRHYDELCCGQQTGGALAQAMTRIVVQVFVLQVGEGGGGKGRG
jgi:hypothetical protein